MKVLDEKGAALVEMAISIVLLMLILFGTIEYGRAMYIRNTLNFAAREGARTAAVTPNLATTGTTSIVNHVRNDVLPPSMQTGTSITVSSSPGGYPSGSTITVTVSQPFVSDVPLLINGIPSPLHGQASMRYEY